MGYIGINTAENAASQRTDGIICMRQYVYIINLSTLVWEANYKRQVFPTKCPGEKNIKLQITKLKKSLSNIQQMVKIGRYEFVPYSKSSS